jgi:hypothetical protein
VFSSTVRDNNIMPWIPLEKAYLLLIGACLPEGRGSGLEWHSVRLSQHGEERAILLHL